MRRQLPFLLGLLCLPGFATQFEVTSGQNIGTVCGSAAAGDICNIHTGTYGTWTPRSGSAGGGNVTYQANGTNLSSTTTGANGDVVAITGGLSVSGLSYVRISGFTVNISGTWVGGNGSTNHVQVDHNTITTSGGSLFNVVYPGGASDNAVSYNKLTVTGNGNNVGIYLAGNRNLLDHNEFVNPGGDCMDVFGSNFVIRNNYCHDINGASGQHIDFVQAQPATPAVTQSLIEGNVEQHCYADGGNCHALIIRGTSSIQMDKNIYRFNFAQNLDGGGITNGGGSSDWASNTAVYNNTFGDFTASDNGAFISCWSASGGTNGVVVANNIAYNLKGNPFECDTGTNGAVLIGGNMAVSPAGTQYCGTPCLASDPQFSNYPTDGTLRSTSPAINAGVAVGGTATGAGTNSTSLVVTIPHAFQPGWAGVNGDCIRVGASSTTCITAIDYNTKTLTVSPAISWSNGAPVYLYKKSDGVVVLSGTLPDIGAFPYAQQVTSVTPPPNLQAVAR